MEAAYLLRPEEVETSEEAVEVVVEWVGVVVEEGVSASRI